MAGYNELKLRTLELFVRSGPIRPAEYMVRAKFYPLEAADAYLRRLTRWGLLQREPDSQGRYLYLISDRGKQRLAWLQEQQKAPPRSESKTTKPTR
jgi:hypothetical protein